MHHNTGGSGSGAIMRFFLSVLLLDAFVERMTILTMVNFPRPLSACHPGYRPYKIGFVKNICEPIMKTRPRPVETCTCVPFYQCRHQDDQDTSFTKCGPTEVCCNDKAPSDETCGWGMRRATESTEADYEEFPWLVAILHVTANETWTPAEYVGGGSIIQPRVVLTAAHKIHGNDKKASELKCRAGEWSRVAAEQNPPQDRLVGSFVVHPAYDRRFLANDVALIILQQPFNLSLPAVRPVCVGKGPPPPGADCFAMGWGRLHYNNTEQYADKLKKVSVPLVSREVCWRALKAVDDERRRASGKKLKPRGELHSSLMCAGGAPGRDVCVGDGGAPLACRVQVNGTHARSAVYGMTAWGVKCGESGAPGVYVDVAKFHLWILDNAKLYGA